MGEDLPSLLTPTILNVGYRSTNYWVVSAGRSRLLVDLGWPGSLGRMQANLRRMDVPLGEIGFALATHYHPDHAGLARELKEAGISLLVLETQLAATEEPSRFVRDGLLRVGAMGNTCISFEQSREVLGSIGLAGEILPTPGHSDDSVSLLLDDGSVFTGDLTPRILIGEDSVAARSWQSLWTRGAKRVHPGHGGIYALTWNG